MRWFQTPALPGTAIERDDSAEDLSERLADPAGYALRQLSDGDEPSADGRLALRDFAERALESIDPYLGDEPCLNETVSFLAHVANERAGWVSDLRALGDYGDGLLAEASDLSGEP